ncbi:hypothetical protein [Haladaptatus sp. NG-SE-30]
MAIASMMPIAINWRSRFREIVEFEFATIGMEEKSTNGTNREDEGE